MINILLFVFLEVITTKYSMRKFENDLKKCKKISSVGNKVTGRNSRCNPNMDYDLILNQMK